MIILAILPWLCLSLSPTSPISGQQSKTSNEKFESSAQEKPEEAGGFSEIIIEPIKIAFGNHTITIEAPKPIITKDASGKLQVLIPGPQIDFSPLRIFSPKPKIAIEEPKIIESNYDIPVPSNIRVEPVQVVVQDPKVSVGRNKVNFSNENSVVNDKVILNPNESSENPASSVSATLKDEYDDNYNSDSNLLSTSSEANLPKISLSSEKMFPISSKIEYYLPTETPSSKSVESFSHSSTDSESSKYNKINNQKSQKILTPSSHLPSSEKLFPLPQDEASNSPQTRMQKPSSLEDTALPSKTSSPPINQVITALSSFKDTYSPLGKSKHSSDVTFSVDAKTSSDISQKTISYHLLPTSRNVNANTPSSVESSSKGVSRIISKGNDIIYEFPSPKDVDFAWIAEDFSGYHPLIRKRSNL